MTGEDSPRITYDRSKDCAVFTIDGIEYELGRKTFEALKQMVSETDAKWQIRMNRTIRSTVLNIIRKNPGIRIDELSRKVAEEIPTANISIPRMTTVTYALYREGMITRVSGDKGYWQLYPGDENDTDPGDDERWRRDCY